MLHHPHSFLIKELTADRLGYTKREATHTTYEVAQRRMFDEMEREGEEEVRMLKTGEGAEPVGWLLEAGSVG